MGRNYSNYSKPQNNIQEKQTILNSIKEEEKQENNIENEVKVEQTSNIKSGIVIPNMLYLRSGPSKDDPMISVLEKGQEVEIILKESINDFYKVHTKDLDGYCMKKFIKVEWEY